VFTLMGWLKNCFDPFVLVPGRPLRVDFGFTATDAALFAASLAAVTDGSSVRIACVSRLIPDLGLSV